MKKGVWKVTACVLAAGMTFSGMSTIAFADQDAVLAGFGYVPTAETEAAVQTEAAQTETEVPEAAALAQTEAVETEAPETEPVVDTSMSGEMAFAQCDEYINIRSEANAGTRYSQATRPAM